MPLPVGRRPKKVAVIGPESTGKSTLCEQLAAHYHSSWVPEFAREWLNLHGKQYGYEELLEIAKGQAALEDKYLKHTEGQSILFIDTEMYVMNEYFS